MKFIRVTLDTFQVEMVPLKDAADLNIFCILVTPETSHLEMFELKAVASRNMLDMVVTRTTHPTGTYLS